VDEKGTQYILKRVMVSNGIGRDMGVVMFKDIDEEGTFIFKFVKHR